MTTLVLVSLALIATGPWFGSMPEPGCLNLLVFAAGLSAFLI